MAGFACCGAAGEAGAGEAAAAAGGGGKDHVFANGGMGGWLRLVVWVVVGSSFVVGGFSGAVGFVSFSFFLFSFPFAFFVVLLGFSTVPEARLS